ncbi:FAD-dependent oxidoreductase [Haliea sp. E1-2-M8]|uniref:NAD(P)-binding protein n=1 Tax=Haliea sp. E1-2-M8 TaxID=3064706 RepID=UPI00271ADD22|nr:NAD(P)-binding protein [Haliea sp. E1-2-M8]MDO8861147.1 FAD-dependent oxidoreductase [Haliea sp. E1-2-M8]
MAERLRITRRDFLGGLAVGVGATALSPLELWAQSSGSVAGNSYPPLLSGLRGSHAGSFEVAHAVSWQGVRYPVPQEQTEASYDLVVVGGGISGLAAAWFYRQQAGPEARILILDNHDDFGGHAKRNEFEVGGQRLIGYGGSQSIDTPSSYSPVAAGLLRDLGIHTERFYDYFDQEYFARRELGTGLYFSASRYGTAATRPHFKPPRWQGGKSIDDTELGAIIGSYPLPEAARATLIELLTAPRDHLPGLSREEKIAFLRSTSYRDFLLQTVRAPEPVYLLLRDSMRGLWGVGYDALSALEGYRYGAPGTEGLGIGALQEDKADHQSEPYIFHFPDGNAGVARALVRQLIPAALPGSGMEDLVLPKVDYAALDRRDNSTRLRLNSTAVEARHSSDGKFVDVTYVTGGEVHRVRGKHTVMACYNNILPHIVPELPAEQVEALGYASKVPLVYISIAVRNWRAFAELGFSHISVPQPELMHSFGLDFPVSMGGYQVVRDPDQPTILHGSYVPTVPEQGFSPIEQHIRGRRALYEMSFEQFEKPVVSQLQGALGAGGFDAARDIAGITVNRWPHGYAYEYNELFDPVAYGPGHGPHLLGARQLGRISIANSDASAYAYVNGAIDAAWRAVQEQTGSVAG